MTLIAGNRARHLRRPAARLLTELARLVGDNHLFVRPDLPADGGPSWAVSAYGLPALAASGSWAKGILDESTSSTNPAERIALVAAKTDVLNTKSILTPPAVRRKLAADLESAVPAVTSPFSRCRARQAARQLRVDTSGWAVSRPDPAVFGQPSHR